LAVFNATKMLTSNAPAACRFYFAHALDHERAKTELKALVPEDVREATGHGIRAKRSKSGAISFEPLKDEPPHAAL
jgi:hypothetical protein